MQRPYVQVYLGSGSCRWTICWSEGDDGTRNRRPTSTICIISNAIAKVHVLTQARRLRRGTSQGRILPNHAIHAGLTASRQSSNTSNSWSRGESGSGWERGLGSSRKSQRWWQCWRLRFHVVYTEAGFECYCNFNCRLCVNSLAAFNPFSWFPDWERKSIKRQRQPR